MAVTASLARSAICAKSPSRIASEGTIQLPPTATTDGNARKSRTLARVMPPVGIQRTPADAYGAEMALRATTPPMAVAGKYLSVVHPAHEANATGSVAGEGRGLVAVQWARTRCEWERRKDRETCERWNGRRRGSGLRGSVTVT